MNQPPSDRVTVDTILRLVEQLSPAEVQELRRSLDSKTWGDRFRQLVQDVSSDNEGTEPLTDDDVADELTKYRREKRAQDA